MPEVKISLPVSTQSDQSRSSFHCQHSERRSPTEERSVTRRRPEAAPAAPPIQTKPARYLINEEAAAHVRLSPRTLEKLRVQGGGPRFRKLGRRVVYLLDDLDSWMDARVCAMTSDPEYRSYR
jgi:predicted DNA-binding transcriptional regulator AlpA